MSTIISTYVLTGQESIDFANSIWNPTVEQINQNIKIFEEIEKNISVTEKKNGFTAVVNNLDTSFLKHDIADCNTQIEVTISYNENSEKFIETYLKYYIATKAKANNNFHDYSNMTITSYAA